MKRIDCDVRMSLTEVANHLRCSKMTIRKWQRDAPCFPEAIPPDCNEWWASDINHWISIAYAIPNHPLNRLCTQR